MRSDIHFRLVGGEQPLIVIPARFNGSEPILCAVDTGASHAMLLPELASRVGVRAESTHEAKGAGGPIQVKMGKAKTIAIGEAMVRDVAVIMTDDFRRIGSAIGVALGGNLGHNVLEHFRLTIDYAAAILRLETTDEPLTERPARAELAFTLAHPSKPLLMVPIEIQSRPYRFAIDTGASTTVISPDVARECEVESTAMPSMTGGGGAVAASSALLASLTIGGASISRVRVAVAEFLGMLSQATGARLDGILGTNVLRRFRVTIDYPRKVLRLE
jgi:predicted aspartyl protease